MNSLIVEKALVQTVDTVEILVHAIATCPYRRYYRTASEWSADAIALAIKGLLALYTWVRLQFQIRQRCLPTAPTPIALLPAAVSPSRILITPVPPASPRILITPAPLTIPVKAVAIAPPTQPVPLRSLTIRQLKNLARGKVKNYSRLTKQQLITQLIQIQLQETGDPEAFLSDMKHHYIHPDPESHG